MNAFSALAEAQYGVVTREQLRRCGLSDREIDGRLQRGTFERVHAGVYRIAGSFPSARQRAIAATLWCGPEAVLSHGTAAALLQLDVRSTKQLHVTVPQTVRRSSADVTLHRVTEPVRPDRLLIDGLPSTSATRTVIDLAASLDEEALETAFESARRMRLTSTGALSRRADTLCGRGHPGSAKIRRLLTVLERRPLESRLEVKVGRLLRQRHLSAPANQYPVGPYRLDFAWPLLLFALECDGFEFHGQRLVWKRDRRRIAALESQGWRVMHVTWDDVVHRPDETVARLQLALARAA